MRTLDAKKYLIALVITAAIFATAIFTSNYFNRQRLAELNSIENSISTDILSLETQFDLLTELSCRDITENSVLSDELNSLATRLSYTENQLGSDNGEVIRLKRSYTLLEIKDYILMKRVSEKCKLDPVFIFYFYSNAGDCPDCTKEGYVLTYLREQYPRLRIYSFDYHLDISALQTLITINKVKPEFPALVMDDKVYYGFKSTEDITKILPTIEQFRDATSTATSTATTTN